MVMGKKERGNDSDSLDIVAVFRPDGLVQIFEV